MAAMAKAVELVSRALLMGLEIRSNETRVNPQEVFFGDGCVLRDSSAFDLALLFVKIVGPRQAIKACARSGFHY